MAGMDVVVVPVDAKGNIDIPALEAAAVKHSTKLAALMITYPEVAGLGIGVAARCVAVPWNRDG